MIQDIEPHIYHNEYKETLIQEEDFVIPIKEHKIYAKEESEISFLTYKKLKEESEKYIDKSLHRIDFIFLFTIDEMNYYGVQRENIEFKDTDSYQYYDINILRKSKPKELAFAGITAYQMQEFYNNTKYCGKCGGRCKPHASMRAMSCLECGNLIFPPIAPSVIVGLYKGDSLLLTKYQKTHSSYQNYALIAGYCEIGESVEQTVIREVQEEVGLKVKNIKYYKSQPWSFSGALLVGFFAEVDGSDMITIEEEELSEASFIKRENLPESVSKISLTGEMIQAFKRKEFF